MSAPHTANWDDMRRKGPAKPLRTATEIAEMLGVSVQRLGRELAADPDAPKCARDNSKAGTRHRAMWYEPGAVRAWWLKKNGG